MRPRHRSAPDRSGYLAQDTIASLASPVGGAIAVIRISGPAALESLSSLGGGEKCLQFETRKLYRLGLKTPEGVLLDDAMVAVFRAPHSYTGENSVELFIHGSPVVGTQILETLQGFGVRQALPGEFSFRAVRNGKLSLSQAEAVSDLISASNDQAAQMALEKMSGAQAVLLGGLAENLRQLATLGEAGIDFSDQDIDELSLGSLQTRLRPIREALLQLEASYERGSKLQDGLRVAFIGLPNAGKSSFFNALLGEDRSIVSEIAGTTRDVVRERLNLRGKRGSVTLRLEDTAGLRSSDDRIEMLGVERSIKAAREADLILLLWDGSLSPQAAEQAYAQIEESWKALGRPVARTLGIITKSDQGLESAQKIQALGIQCAEPTSAVSGEKIHEAAEAIADFCEKWVRRDPGEVLLTRLEHLNAVREALVHLERASGAPEIDLFAADLRQSLKALAPLVGETLPDDILGRVFSQFCIGK